MLLGRSVICGLPGWLVGWRVDRLVGWSVGCLVPEFCQHAQNHQSCRHSRGFGLWVLVPDSQAMRDSIAALEKKKVQLSELVEEERGVTANLRARIAELEPMEAAGQ